MLVDYEPGNHLGSSQSVALFSVQNQGDVCFQASSFFFQSKGNIGFGLVCIQKQGDVGFGLACVQNQGGVGFGLVCIQNQVDVGFRQAFCSEPG